MLKKIPNKKNRKNLISNRKIPKKYNYRLKEINPEILNHSKP
jgi:hypothetical protein